MKFILNRNFFLVTCFTATIFLKLSSACSPRCVKSPVEDIVFSRDVNYLLFTRQRLYESRVTERCENLPDFWNRDGKVTLEVKAACVLLYSGSDCYGSPTRFITGNYNVGNLTTTGISFHSCYNVNWAHKGRHERLKFYKAGDFEGLLLDTEIPAEGCANTDCGGNWIARSIITPRCLDLFTDQNCRGYTMKVPAGRQSPQQLPGLPYFNIGSFRPC